MVDNWFLYRTCFCLLSFKEGRNMLEKLITTTYECSELTKPTSLFYVIIVIYFIIGIVFSIRRAYQSSNELNNISFMDFAISFVFYVLLPILIPIAILFVILVKSDYCDKCRKIIWRWQSSVRKEEPFISSDGNNYPIIQNWHKKCYKKRKKC